ncbi:MAG: N-formylglutamate amidohydrolase [Candidatus Sphingomonas colombiensis]|nr:N-formylglutamate amidohydrolase [Sphingomonas sp.]WEK41985.1 MAG: N-formylglutamate amidohydrolase [Sphingomonas sp.]
MTSSFDLLGAETPESPVVISVPHAGREYPLALRANLRVPVELLASLEDRHVDTVALAARGRETLIIQRLGRAWIDLNRAEHERDPAVDEGAPGGHPSVKVRGGLGIVPRRTGRVSDIWRRRFSGDEIAARIAADHRPYHAALKEALERAHARFGCAVLLDLHSMPPITEGNARIVTGDRFGQSCSVRYMRRVEAVVAAAGLRHIRNTPYPGGHILDRHGKPATHIHAIQLELDRSLYLDRAFDKPGAGFDMTVSLVRATIDALADEALDTPTALAAE